jgi:hypothetical protein
VIRTQGSRDRKRASERIAGMTAAQLDHKRGRQRLSGMTPEQVELRRARSTRWYRKIVEDGPRYRHMNALKGQWRDGSIEERIDQRLGDLGVPAGAAPGLAQQLFPNARCLQAGFWERLRAEEDARYRQAMKEREGRLSFGLPRDTT